MDVCVGIQNPSVKGFRELKGGNPNFKTLDLPPFVKFKK
jgi:hypothetical protein